MAVINLGIPTLFIDVVAVYDDTYNLVLEDARYMNATIRETSRPLEHPIETGVVIADQKIIDPIEVELSIIAERENFRNVYNELKSLYKSSDLLILQTKTTSYKRLYITEMPHDERSDMFDAISISVRLRESITTQKATFFFPQDAENSSVVEKGEQQSKDQSLLSSGFDSVSSFLGSLF